MWTSMHLFVQSKLRNIVWSDMNTYQGTSTRKRYTHCLCWWLSNVLYMAVSIGEVNDAITLAKSTNQKPCKYRVHSVAIMFGWQKPTLEQ